MKSIVARTWGKPIVRNLTTLFFQNKKGEIIRFDRPISEN
jgi:hypothetical protein